MKRLLLITFMLVFLMSVVPAFAQEDLDATLEWMEFGMTIDYPSAWQYSIYPDSDYYVIAENPEDIQTLSFDPEGQYLIIWVINEANMAVMGDNPEDVVDYYASEYIEDWRSRDMDEIETENDYEMPYTSGDVADGGFLIVTSVQGPDDDLFLFIGTSPRRDSEDLEENVRAMLDTLELEVPEDIIESGRVDDATPLEYGDIVEGEITSRQASEEFVFEGEQGDILNIRMSSTNSRDDLDSYLVLVNQDGREIAANDDINTAGGIYDSQISGYVLPEDGTYIIIATRFQREGGTSTGEYELSLDIIVLGEGEEILSEEGEITNRRSSEEYEFDGNAGDLVTITMVDTSRDDALDPQVILLDPDGNEIARNDDAIDTSIGSLNSQIFAYQLPENGTYTVVATRYLEDDGESEGEYEISVIVYAGEDISTQEQDVEGENDYILEYGETSQGEISDETFQEEYTFEGSEGDVVTITMIDTSEDDSLDPLLILLDPEGNELTRNDDGNASVVGQFNSQILNFTLPADGTYTVIATRFSQESGNTAGEYEIALVEGEVEGGK